MEYAVAYLKEDIVPSGRMYMPRKNRDSKDDSDFYTYYALLINDALREIRRGREEYVYNFEQIKDIMRFEADITVRCDPASGAYCIKLEK